jgi:ATP-dependent RNA helicase DDX55/SPB4
VLTALLAFHRPSAAAISAEGHGYDVDPEARIVLPQLIIGGSQTVAQDISKFLEGPSPNVLIGTPGRLLEILSSSHVHCPQSSFEVLILDEADRLLDLGFKDEIQKIIGLLPKQRRTGLFSASVSEAVGQIIRVGLRNPVRISVKVKSNGSSDGRTPASLQMSYFLANASQKLPAFKQLLGSIHPTPQKTIVYLSTCAAVDYFQHLFPLLIPDFTTVPLHGKHLPKVRARNFTKFSESISPTILLTTDVAARGLDIPLVDLVVQIDPPSDPKVFLHRCGRSGRAGRKGLAVVLLTPSREEDYIPFLSVRKTPVSKLEEPVIKVTAREAESTSAKIRDLVLTDRALYDKAQKGFVSWVRAYSKHQASSIFRVSELDWQDLGNAWGLLKLPSMPELKGWDGDRSLGVQLNLEDVKYKDAVREKRRAEASATNDAPRAGMRKDGNESWSGKKAAKDLRATRREKRHAKKEGIRRSMMTDDQVVEAEQVWRMIQQVREQNKGGEEEWHGFDD